MEALADDGVRLWWESSGSGDPVLLLNGLGSPSDVWFRLAPHLSAGYRVLTMDNRGTGRSEVPPGPYPITRLAADAIAVLDAAGAAAAHVLGISMGGLIAQEVALANPKRVLSLILVSTHPGFTEPRVSDPEAVQSLAAAAALPGDERVDALIPFIYAPATPRERIAEDHAVRAGRPTTQAGFVAQLQGAGTWGRPQDLASLGVPVLVLHGRQDRLVPLPNGERLAELIPGSRLHVLEGASHEVFTDAEREAADAVLSFLATVPVMLGE
jgi:pimeloyl-ACP methyl ester carboxylesterase